MINVVLFFYLLFLSPKLLFDRLIKGKRHPGFLQRLGFGIPKADRPVTWIHAVSVGEVKAAQPLFNALRLQEPDAFYLITTTTATGQAEAKRSFLDADAIAYLPLDFTWVVRRWVKKLNPRRFLFIESDFWPNLLSALRKNNTQISLVSGKISPRSAKRFALFPRFAKKLFSHFDHICLQNEEYLRLFTPLVSDPSRLRVTGNLKLDLKPQPTSPLQLPQNAIAITCTHPGEEEPLLDALSSYFLVLAPRHPERFEDVAKLLAKKKTPFTRWSEGRIEGKILLIDAMGQLPSLYAHSRLAILGGSFVDHIGGHNILEPCLYGTPVLFGPYMQKQREFAKRVTESGAGLQVPLEDLRHTVDAFFNHPYREQAMREAVQKLLQTGAGSTQRTLQQILK